MHTTKTRTTSTTDVRVDPDINQLKRLLFVDEQRELGVLRAHVADLDRRVGSDDRFTRSVADSLVVALKAVEVENHRDLARVMAPLVVSGIRREITESRDMMVETLYPITGRLVTAAVAGAIRELSDDINRKLETSLSPKQLKLRIKALITRRPLSELLLADAANGRFDRLILIERASGAVLATTKADADSDGALNLLGGLVAAIVEFANHALHDIHGDLRSIDVGGRSVLLRASPLYIVAALTSASSISPKLHASADQAFLDLLDHMVDHDPEKAPAILSALHADLDQQLEPPAKARSRLSPVTVIIAALALGLVFAAGKTWLSAHRHATEAATLAAIEHMPALLDYPVKLDFDRDAGLIRAFGILPSSAAAAELKARLSEAFPHWPVAARLMIASDMPPASAVDQAMKAADTRIAALEKDLAQERAELASLRAKATTDVSTSASELNRRLQDARHDLDAATARLSAIEKDTPRLDAALAQRPSQAELQGRIDALEGRILTPQLRLETAIAHTAVFFGDGASYRDPARTAHDLSALAGALASADGARIRIIGYGDGSGTPKGNADAARMRAEHVATDLEALGVDMNRLVLVTTRAPLPIADGAGVNKRVVFELAFSSE